MKQLGVVECKRSKMKGVSFEMVDWLLLIKKSQWEVEEFGCDCRVMVKSSLTILWCNNDEALKMRRFD